MEITREQVLAEATKLGITLSEEQINKFISDKKLPDAEWKYEQRYATLEAEIKAGTKTTADLLALIKERDSESRDRRLKNKELQDQLDAIKAAEKKKAEDDLIAKGELQKVIDAKQKELDELTPYKEKFTALETQTREAYLKELTAEHQEFAKDLPTEKLMVYAVMHKVKDPDPTHNGNISYVNGSVKLTDWEKTEAKKMMLDDVAYAEVRDSRIKNKEKLITK